MSVYTTNNRLKRMLGTKKGSAIGVGTATLLVIILMIFFAIIPAYRSISDQIKNNEVKTIYFNDLQAKKTSLDKLAQYYNSNKILIDHFNSYNNTNPNTEDLLANLSKMAIQNNFILTDFLTTSQGQSSSTKTSSFLAFPSITPQTVNLQFEGKLSGIGSLISDLEKFPLTIKIDNLSITQKMDITLSSNKKSLLENDTILLSFSGEFYFWNVIL